MDKVKIENLIDNILVSVPNCPSVMTERALNEAIRDWYHDTHCWKEELPEITCFDDVSVYALRKADCTEVLSIDGAQLNDATIPVTFMPPAQLRINRKVKNGDKITVTASLSITPHSDSVPCAHASKYIDKWQYGALWHLLAMPTQVWSNPNLAEYNRNLFRNCIASERIEMLSQRQYGSIRVRSNIIL